MAREDACADFLPSAGFDPETAQALLKLDPWVARAPSLKPDSACFHFEENYEFNGGLKIRTLTHTAEQADSLAHTTYSARVEDDSQGWLGYLGLGVTETKQVTAKFSNSASRKVQVGQQVTAEADFYAAWDEVYAVDVDDDRVFGTFAFRSVPLRHAPVLAGIATDALGHLMPNQLVTVWAGGRKYTTYTDAQGRYAFHSPEIPRGAATLQIGKVRKQITIDRSAVSRPRTLGPTAPIRPQ